MKNIISIITFILLTIAVKSENIAKDSIPWHLLDAQQDNYLGISLQQAYNFLKENKIKPQKVIVAVIDSGIDTTHEDIVDNLWHNPREIPYNNKDDDGNGYIDDIFGWNFIGGADGRNINGETIESVRFYRENIKKYEGKKEAEIPAADLSDYKLWIKTKAEVLGKIKQYNNTKSNLEDWLEGISESEKILNFEAKADSLSRAQLKAIVPKTKEEIYAKDILLRSYKIGYTKDVVKEGISYYSKKLEKTYNLEYNPRPEIVNDNVDDIRDTIYGNNDVMAVGNSHGTGVSGIIGALRDNGVGTQGIVDSVKIMMLRVVPGGDERDKDVALAIRYAVNNGAKIINCSFGKKYSKHPDFVLDAIDYAKANNVLIIHAAGNNSENNDKIKHYPTPRDNQRSNWIDVGASGKNNNLNLAATFTNYGKNTVDVFAPGVDIYSTVPIHNKYRSSSGTSDACPVVTGVAALLKSYFPKLSGEEIRLILLQSANKLPKTKVLKPGSKTKKIKFKKLSTTAGIVNAYRAVKLAQELYPNN